MYPLPQKSFVSFILFFPLLLLFVKKKTLLNWRPERQDQKEWLMMISTHSNSLSMPFILSPSLSEIHSPPRIILWENECTILGSRFLMKLGQWRGRKRDWLRGWREIGWRQVHEAVCIVLYIVYRIVSYVIHEEEKSSHVKSLCTLLTQHTCCMILANRILTNSSSFPLHQFSLSLSLLSHTTVDIC